jgi:hypothetical protein
VGGQPGKPKPPGNPIEREPPRVPPVEEPPDPIPVPPTEPPPAPLEAALDYPLRLTEPVESDLVL